MSYYNAKQTKQESIIEFIDMVIIMSKKSYKYSLENYNIIILYLMLLYEKDKTTDGSLTLAKYIKDTYKKTNDFDIGLKNITIFFKTLVYCGILSDNYQITDNINYITIDDVINMVYHAQDVKLYLRLKKLKTIMK